MKTAKSSKIISLLTVLALSIAALLFCAPVTTPVKAANPSVASMYFSGTAKEVAFKENVVSANLEKDGYLEINNDLVLDHLALETKLEDAVKTLEISFVTDSYNVNGNVKYESYGKALVKDVEHLLTIVKNGTALEVNFNGVAGAATLSGNLEVRFKVENNVVSATVEGNEIVSAGEEYLVKDIDKCIAKDIKLTVKEFNGTATETAIGLVSIDQDYNDATGKYKQTFELENDQIKSVATPYGIIDNSFFAADGKIYLKKSQQYTFTLRSLAVLDEIAAANLKLTAEQTEITNGNIALTNEDNPKTIVFKVEGTNKFNIETSLSTYTDKLLRKEISVEVYGANTDAIAPVYDTAKVGTSQFYAYEEAVKQASISYNKDTGKYEYIKLGEKYNVPSLENFVTDNYSGYADLASTVYYKTPTEEGTSSDMKIPVEEAGDYIFYVVFTDKYDNAMEKDDFYTVDENDDNKLTYGTYVDFVFDFHVEDDAGFNIETQKKQGTGYTGQTYTATAFNIKANNYTAVYNLYYNAKENATSADDGWVEIIQKKNLTDNYTNEVFTAEDIKSINYNGSLSFTPNKTGTYKLTCKITSDNTNRYSEAETFIQIKTPTTVTPYEPLETREILAIVFLSVGGLCLIGIIVLIFIKPKENTTAKDDE